MADGRTTWQAIDVPADAHVAGKSQDQATDKVAQGGYFDAPTNTLSGCTHSR
ncbi:MULTISPECIES: hypothetical protein [Burkholderia]|uniref:hypothetical protein n=1 Tax=Burkholderia TaxID=32008 RepID=UPI001F2F4477|nr:MULTISPECIES: hypothetical protein [Burkholderia]